MGLSDTVWLAIIGVITIVVKEYFDRLRAKDAAVKLNDVSEKVEVTQGDVLRIEKATNSMKDALVKATGDARFLEGKAEAASETKAAATVDDAAKMQVEHIDVETMTVAKTEKKL